MLDLRFCGRPARQEFYDLLFLFFNGKTNSGHLFLKCSELFFLSIFHFFPALYFQMKIFFLLFQIPQFTLTIFQFLGHGFSSLNIVLVA